ncbi:MAG: protein kinase [Deltaproteobacteria bacterium]|nr:protein kinase [Deltaproteobacteria bacterium]
MGGHTAEQIVAGVVLYDRLAVTMYGAIHRAQFNGVRNLRGLVIDPKMLAESTFRATITDPRRTGQAIALAHDNIVPTLSVEDGGPEVVVVSRGVGRYVTVQDLIVGARANRREGGKLPLPVAAAIIQSVVGALAVAHRAGVVHGAVHPRSVLVDEDGGIRIGDFVVGRALTTAVAQGADSSLWRGLTGYLAPELVVGEPPTPACDVFACGAMLFTMLSGEVPPGTLHVTPAVERLVQRALDSDVTRRYKNASDLLENVLEAFEDDRWEIAERGELIRAAGLSGTDTNIDDATEDLLASLGSSAVQVTPMRPSMESRAEAAAARHQKTPTGANRLESLLNDLNDPHTRVDEMPSFGRADRDRDPISELIQADPRKKEAIVQIKSRVPSLDDPDDTPLPAPRAHDSHDDTDVPRPNVRDEDAAMAAILGLDRPAQRMSSAAEQVEAAAAKLQQAAARAEAAAEVVATKSAPRPVVAPVPARSLPIVEAPDFSPPPARIKSKAGPIVGVITILAIIGIGVFVYKQQADAAEEREKQRQKDEEDQRKADELSAQLAAAGSDTGAIEIASTPSEGGVWMRLGPTPVESFQLEATATHEIAVLLEGYQLGEIQVVGADWTGTGDKQRAELKIGLKKLEPDKKTKQLVPAELPLQPARGQEKTARVGGGRIKVTSVPSDAEAYLFVGVTGRGMRVNRLTAGRDYELVIVKPGYRAKKVQIKADEWRDDPDPKKSIDAAKKKATVRRSVELEELPKKPEK